MFCPHCGHQGTARDHTPGSMGIELVLWLCLIIPGLIYSLWRLSARRPVCARCGAAGLLPEDSPAAHACMRELGITPSSDPYAMTRPPSARMASLGRAMGHLAGRLRR